MLLRKGDNGIICTNEFELSLVLGATQNYLDMHFYLDIEDNGIEYTLKAYDKSSNIYDESYYKEALKGAVTDIIITKQPEDRKHESTQYKVVFVDKLAEDIHEHALRMIKGVYERNIKQIEKLSDRRLR